MNKRKFEKPLEEKKKGVVKTRSGLITVDKTVQFMDAFYQNGGNITEAALDTFDCSTRASAAEIGRKYLKKAQNRGLVQSYMENNKITYGKLIEHAFKMLDVSKNTGWWDRLMKEGGYTQNAENSTKVGAAPVTVNVHQAHKSMMEEYIEAEVVEEEEDGGKTPQKK